MSSSVLSSLRHPATLPERTLAWFRRDLHATWGLAVTRMVIGFFTMALVVTEWKDRQFFWGDASGWAQPYRDETLYTRPWWHFFDPGDSGDLFSLKLVFVGVLGFLVFIGLFTRPAVILLFFTMTSLIAQGPTSTDTEDIVVRIVLFFMIFADTSQRMSVDRWIAERRGRIIDIGGVRPVRTGIIPMTVRIPLHNMALTLIGAQIIVLYVMAGRAKLSGAKWLDGTATYYPFHAEYLTPWPELSHHLGQWTPLVMLMTYGSIAVQLLFPFMLLQRYTRIFIIVAMIGLHIGIAVTLGLGLFSFAMCGADFVFIRDESVDEVKAWIAARRGRSRESGPQEVGIAPESFPAAD